MPKRKASTTPQWSKSQLAHMFDMNRNTVVKRLRDVTPSGKCSRGHPTYTVALAAPYLIDEFPLENPVDPEIGEIDPSRLSPEAAKDYWDAELKRQTWRQREGELWDTMQVIEVFSGLLKPLAHSIRSLPDVLERRLNLKPAQVEIMQAEITRALEDAHENVTEYAGSLSGPDRDTD